VIAALALTLATVQIVSIVAKMLWLHPLEYVAINEIAGGTEHAAGRFELDYWGAASTEAVRILEHRLDGDTSGYFGAEPPRVFVCILAREWMAGRLFRRDWRLVDEVAQADFIIDTERSPRVKNTPVLLIDEVKRLGVSYSRIYGNNRGRKFAPPQ
jgi:hypothetical protein